jgi:dual specificity tyrosine-phosphorylation-regulated kinase 2/3/4
VEKNQNQIKQQEKYLMTEKIGLSPVKSKIFAQSGSPKAVIESTKRNSLEASVLNDKITVNSQTLAKSGPQVLQYLCHRLTSFEKSELLDYPEVFFTGNILKRPEIPVHSLKLDDELGNLILLPGDHVAYQFEIIEKLGHGSFGQVFKVLDHKTCTLKALKVISSGSKFQDQAFVEVKILRFLKKLDKDETYSIVHIEDYFSFRKHFCITFELLSFSLYDVLKKNNFQGISNSLIRRFASQILRCLMLLHSHKVVHCDLKPENILLKNQNRSVVKVIDFGSSCFEREKVFDYVQSRFYRAPEIVLGVEYGCGIDVWSFGCILAELFIGKPILPARNEADLLMRTVELIGNPPEELLRRARRTKDFWVGRIWRATEKVKFRRPLGRSIEKILFGADEPFIDFVKSCLKWDPNERISPSQALDHPWLK